MKKLLSFLAISSTLLFFSCGGSSSSNKSQKTLTSKAVIEINFVDLNTFRITRIISNTSTPSCPLEFSDDDKGSQMQIIHGIQENEYIFHQLTKEGIQVVDGEYETITTTRLENHGTKVLPTLGVYSVDDTDFSVLLNVKETILEITQTCRI